MTKTVSRHCQSPLRSKNCLWLRRIGLRLMFSSTTKASIFCVLYPMLWELWGLFTRVNKNYFWFCVNPNIVSSSPFRFFIQASGGFFTCMCLLKIQGDTLQISRALLLCVSDPVSLSSSILAGIFPCRFLGALTFQPSSSVSLIKIN